MKENTRERIQLAASVLLLAMAAILLISALTKPAECSTGGALIAIIPMFTATYISTVRQRREAKSEETAQ
ncbi:MAG: hypothetical protein IJ806_05660 [Ruminococcus sp.]|nr:hypothetical protein [Ruminococcus sp.]